MKEWKLPSWRNAIQAATRFSNVQLVSSLKGSSKVHRYSHQVLYRSHRVYKTEKWLPMHYPQEHRFHVLILKCLDTLYRSQCKNIGTLCATETTKFSLNELCPPLMWLPPVWQQRHCKEAFWSHQLQKVSNKEIACLVNRYMSDRGNLAINLKAK